MSTICNTIQYICTVIVPAIKTGVVELRRSGLPIEYYVPTEDTDLGRGEALIAALIKAEETPTLKTSIHLLNGRYALVAGTRLYTYLPSVIDASIIFEGSSALIYGDPTDPGGTLAMNYQDGDFRLFHGPRNVINFGADPNAIDDSWDAFTACKHTLGYGYRNDEFGVPVRSGPKIIIPPGNYLMSKPFTQQAGQTWEGQYRAAVIFGPNIAPNPPSSWNTAKWAWTIARTNIQDGVGIAANFTHDVKLLNLVITCNGVGNQYLGGAKFGSAQTSEYAFIDLVGFGAGIDFHVFACMAMVHDINIINISGALGPAFSVYLNNSTTFDRISVVAFNQLGTYSDISVPDIGYSGDGDYMPAYRIHHCRENGFHQLNAEGTPRGMKISAGWVNKVEITHSAYSPNPSSSGVDISGGIGNEVTIRGNNTTYLIREDMGGGYAVIAAGSPADAMSNYRQSIQNTTIVSTKGIVMRTSTVNPVAADIPDGTSIVWRNTTIPEIRTWSNVGGTLLKSAPFT